MSSAGARCDHINHVSTQIPYAVTVAAVSFVSFLVAALIANLLPNMQTWLISLPIAIILMICTLFVIKSVVSKKES